MALLEKKISAGESLSGDKEESQLRGQTFGKGQYASRAQGQFQGQSQTRGQRPSHKLHMTDREGLTITGVKDVLSFDVTEVILETEMGMLCIRGNDLHITRLTLDKGEVDAAGKVDSLTYSDAGAYRKQGESLLGRLFR